MTLLSTARFLFFVLIALICGAWDWVVWQWQESTADQQIKAMAFGTLFAAIVVNHLFGSFIFRVFF